MGDENWDVWNKGEHDAVWDLRREDGRAVGGGLYFARFEVDGRLVRTRRVVVIP